MAAAVKKKQLGRYDTANVQMLPQGLADLPRRSSIDTVVAAVDDPMEHHRSFDDPKRKRILARVNRNVDILEMERSHKRISDGAYRMGRIIQAVFERAAGVRDEGLNLLSGVRADPVTAREVRMVAALDSARASVELIDKIRQCIGYIDALIVRQVIQDGWSYEQVASSRGLAGARLVSYCAGRFRDALEALDAHLDI